MQATKDCRTLAVIGFLRVESGHFEPLKVRTLLDDTVAHLSGEDLVVCVGDTDFNVYFELMVG